MSLCMQRCSEEDAADEGWGGCSSSKPFRGAELSSLYVPPTRHRKSPVPLNTKSYCEDFTGLQEHQQHCVKH